MLTPGLHKKVEKHTAHLSFPLRPLRISATSALKWLLKRRDTQRAAEGKLSNFGHYLVTLGLFVQSR